ncbi:MAG: hypothetical protein ACP5DY_01170 [Thermovirgaceae bacterium]
MKKKAKNALLCLLVLSVFSWLTARPAAAGINVLSVPGHPLSLVLDTKGGIIDLALLRSPAGIQKILPLEGFMLKGQTVRTPYADGDLVKDLLWTLDFREPAGNSRGIQLWIGALSGSKRAWVCLCPVARTFWDNMHLDLYVPEGFGLYFAPTAPGYGDLPRYAGSRTLGFVYTISLTPEGPRFVPSPDVYRQLQRIADLVRKAEQIPYRKEAYKHMIEDFARLSRGSEPSTAAIRNFVWERILTLQWR